MAPPHIFLHVTNSLIIFAVYSIFHLKSPKQNKNNVSCKVVNVYVEEPYGTLSACNKNIDLQISS